MTRSRPIFVLFVALVITSAPLRAADDVYSIHFKELGPGEVSSYVVRETGEVNVRIETARGRSLFPQTVRFSEDLSFWEQVLEKPAGEAPTRTLRRYGTARYNQDGEEAILPLEGKRVTIERRGDQYTYTIDGVRPGLSKHREVLEAEFTDDLPVQPYLPGRPVRINEVYAINGKPLAAALAKYSGMEFDINHVEARGWLAAVYNHHGRRFGRIVADFRFPVTGVTVEGKLFAMRHGDMTILQTTFDVCIDGSARIGTARTVTQINTSTEGLRLAVRVTATGERTVTILEAAR